MSRCPFAAWNPIRGYPGLTFVPGVPMRGVLHSTEVPGIYNPRADGSYFGGASPPHFTVDAAGVWQHVDTGLGSYALLNRSGGVETNREGCIQIEVMGRASEAPDWPLDVYRELAKLMRWIEADCGIDASYVDDGHASLDDWYWPDGRVRYRVGTEPWRISFTDWPSVNCWVGHQHCPENEHTDPGKVRLDLLFPAKSGGTPAPAQRFTDFQEEEMRQTLLNTGPPGYLLVAHPRWDPGFGRPPTIVSAIPNGLVGIRGPIGAHVEDNSVVLDIVMAGEDGQPVDPFDVHVVVA